MTTFSGTTLDMTRSNAPTSLGRLFAGTYAFGAVWIEYVATKLVARKGSLTTDMENL